MRYLRRALGLAVVLGACTGPSEIPTFDFYSQTVFGFPTIGPDVTVSKRTVQVVGIISTETSGYSLLGELQTPAPNSLTVYVSARRSPGGLNFRTQNYYAATVKNLAKGDYQVTMIHVIDRNTADTVTTIRDSTLILRQGITIR